MCLVLKHADLTPSIMIEHISVSLISHIILVCIMICYTVKRFNKFISILIDFIVTFARLL